MKVRLLGNAIMPTRAHETDAGLDLYSPVGFTLLAKGSYFVDTGVCIKLPKGTVGMVKSRSGLMKNFDIVCEGVIDEDYTGPIGIELMNHGDKDVTIHIGDRIGQLVILECCKPTLELVDKLDDTTRGNKGFGSTGK